jgi:hypothetical protein
MSSTNGAVATAPSPIHACGRSKREVYDWADSGDHGELRWLHKDVINVDHTYQRKNVSLARVNEIAANWSWPAIIAIGVAQRSDGTYWAYDGQHRVLAAKKRDDIRELPCVVFHVRSIESEAQTFVTSNTARGAMRRIDKYKAQLVAGDKAALAIEELCESCGYKISGGSSEGTISCVEAIDSAVRTDFGAAREAFLMCATLAARKPFHAKLYRAMFHLEQHLRKSDMSVSHANVRDKLYMSSADGLLDSIYESEKYHKKGGARIGAQGLVQYINKGRRTRHIPTIL